LSSVLAQDLTDTELLLVDNCSTDRTVERARELIGSRSDSRVVVNESNLGRVANWNRCIDLARGEFIKFAFTNDALLPGALTLLVDAIQHDPEAVMAGSRQWAVHGMPDELPPVPDRTARNSMESGDALEYFARHGFADAGSLNGMIFRRAALQQHGLRFDESIPYFADFALALELAAFGRTVLLDAETHCFDHGAQQRYHHVGQKNPSVYLADYGRCIRRLMVLLENTGRDRRVALDYLEGKYYWYLGQGWDIWPLDAVRTFSGFPSYQVSAAAKTLWNRARRAMLKASRVK
jgi:glycosyltransferase involved in cell wall biosynthesis